MTYIKHAAEDTIARISEMFPVLIDEIQYATELLPYIKMNIDRSKKRVISGLRDHRYSVLWKM